MQAKTIALDREAYELLKSKKGKDETFSDVVKRLTRPRRGISDLAGSLSNLPKSVWDDIAANRARMRNAELVHARSRLSARENR
jgi:predicted CopG family antitoxin